MALAMEFVAMMAQVARIVGAGLLLALSFNPAFGGCSGIASNGERYYRLNDCEARYFKLSDKPIPPIKEKRLHPSSIYKQERPAREKKEPDYSRNKITNNEQALTRLNNSIR